MTKIYIVITLLCTSIFILSVGLNAGHKELEAQEILGELEVLDLEKKEIRP